jgi:hypothetical protein
MAAKDAPRRCRPEPRSSAVRVPAEMVVVTLGDIREAARGTAFELARDALPLAAGDRRVILRSKGGHGDEDLVAGPGREARRAGALYWRGVIQASVGHMDRYTSGLRGVQAGSKSRRETPRYLEPQMNTDGRRYGTMGRFTIEGQVRFRDSLFHGPSPL